MDALTDTKEMKKEVPVITLAFAFFIIIGLGLLGYQIGHEKAKIESQSEIQQLLHSFAIDEVSGLRSDVNREVFLLRQEKSALELRVQRIEQLLLFENK